MDQTPGGPVEEGCVEEGCVEEGCVQGGKRVVVHQCDKEALHV